MHSEKRAMVPVVDKPGEPIWTPGEVCPSCGEVWTVNVEVTRKPYAYWCSRCQCRWHYREISANGTIYPETSHWYGAEEPEPAGGAAEETVRLRCNYCRAPIRMPEHAEPETSFWFRDEVWRDGFGGKDPTKRPIRAFCTLGCMHAWFAGMNPPGR